MNKRIRALIEYGKQCGFTLAGTDGRNHFVLEHPNGEKMRLPATPGDHRG